MIRRQFGRNLLLVLLGAVMWHCSQMLHWMRTEQLRETIQKGAGTMWVCVDTLPLPEVAAILLLFVIAMAANRHSFGPEVSARWLKIGLTAGGVVAGALVLGTLVGVTVYAWWL